MDLRTKIIEQASLVKNNAYSPYSKFKVGASILTSNNNIYSGCNVENASYGATVCAESSAICSMVTNQEYNIKEIAITSSSNELCYPCGMCLQKISEFADHNTLIHLSINNKLISSYKLKDMLPNIFDKSVLFT